MLAQVQQWEVTLSVIGQTGAGQVCHSSSKQAKENPFSKNKAQKQAWTRNCKEGCDQQGQKPHLLCMLPKGSHGQRFRKWYHS
jgi:invasion protein IalB